MKRFRILLVSILCFAMLLSSYMQVHATESVSPDGPFDKYIDWAVLRQFFVCVTDDTDVTDYAIPEWAQPEWTLVGSTEKGDIYFLFCVINSSQSDEFAQILTEILTGEQGVIEYLTYAEHKEMGDINADGAANAEDALLCLQMVVGKYQPKTVDEYMRALVSKYRVSGIPLQPSASCALYILQMVVGKY